MIVSDEDERYYVRRFLNEKRGVATIEIEGSTWTNGDTASLDADVDISDCTRHISLEFYTVVNPKDEYDRRHTVEERLYKIDTLIEELTAFRAWYVERVEELVDKVSAEV